MDESLVAREFEFDSLRQRVIIFLVSLISCIKSAHLAGSIPPPPPKVHDLLWLFSHYTHEAMVETHQGVLFVNPGSPSLVKQNTRLGTVAILEITPDSRAAQ
jgi:hypothetical protein